MANRKLPFGYKMQRGKICINAQEADIVREIYTAYARRVSYKQLTQQLNGQAIPYNEPGKRWNKNMVARILGNDAYVGDDTYPAIITRAEHHRAVSAKPATGVPRDSSRSAKAIRQLARCAVCGESLALSANCYGWARWNCPACASLTEDAITPVITDEVFYILSAITKCPEKVQTPPQNPPLMQDGIQQLENSFSDMLTEAVFNEAAARSAAMTLAAARFNSRGSEDYETMRIQYILARTEQSDELNIDLLRQITSSILIHPTGTVSLKLKNGQIIKRSDLT